MRPLYLAAITLGVVAGTFTTALVPGLDAPSLAGTALKMDLDEVFQRSDLVVEGRLVAAESREDEDGLIVTDWQLEVDRTFWGAHEPRRTLRLPGGVLASGRGMLIPGLPRLSVGEDVVLLLGEAARSGMRMPTGLSQGKYRVVTAIDGSRVALQDGGDVTLVTPELTSTPRGVNRLDHAELVARLEAARATRRALEGYAEPNGAAEGGR